MSAQRGSGWDRITVQERRSWKSMSLLSRCSLHAWEKKTAANPSKQGSVTSQGTAAGAQEHGSSRHYSEHPQHSPRMSSAAAQGDAVPRAITSWEGSATVGAGGSPTAGPGSLPSLMDEHSACSLVPDSWKHCTHGAGPFPKASCPAQGGAAHGAVLLTELCSTPGGRSSQELG